MTSEGSVFPALALLALGLTPRLAAQPTPRPSEAPKAESYVTEKGFSNRIFEIRHRDPSELAQVLRPLLSSFRGAEISPNLEFRTISVRDFPENIAAIEAALKRLDVAEAPRPDVELRLWVLVASQGSAAAGRLPEDLKEVVEALKSTLTYRSYALAGTFVQRVRAGARNVKGEGVTDLADLGEIKGAKPMQLEYRIRSLALEPSEKERNGLKLDGFWLTLVGDGRAHLETDVTLRDGEKVVVGTATVRDRALVVVLSGKVIR